MLVAWHPTRWGEWCKSGEKMKKKKKKQRKKEIKKEKKKKEIEPILTDKN